MSLRWLIAGTILFAAAAAVVVVHSPYMSLDTIDIRGADETDVAAVVSEAGVGPGAILLWVDTGQLADQIMQEPWVADVRVDRIWPRTLEIEVAEREPAVWIEGAISWMLVARDGTVLERVHEPGGGHMRAAVAFSDWDAGEQPADPAWYEIVEMALVLADDIGSTMTLEMRGEEMWTHALGHDVRLGLPIDLADKGRALRAMLAEDLPGGSIVDVSSPLRPAIVPVEAQLRVETGDAEDSSSP